MTLSLAAARTTHGRLRRLAVPAATFGGLAIATAALHFRDPHIDGSWGLCPSAAIFGIYCPGCGGLRAVNDLTHGDLGSAASSNLLFFVSIPLVVFLLARWGYDAWRGSRPRPDLAVVLVDDLRRSGDCPGLHHRAQPPDGLVAGALRPNLKRVRPGALLRAGLDGDGSVGVEVDTALPVTARRIQSTEKAMPM